MPWGLKDPRYLLRIKKSSQRTAASSTIHFTEYTNVVAEELAQKLDSTHFAIYRRLKPTAYFQENVTENSYVS